MVFLSGGISNAAELRLALDAGYAGALCGTVFAATEESAAHARYKQAIVDARQDDTVVTDRFSIGWHTHRHRVIRNRSCDGDLSVTASLDLPTISENATPSCATALLCPLPRPRGRSRTWRCIAGRPARTRMPSAP
ncbi:nitronate monooxygenase [Achromobacter xylosoxidans]